jgi:methylmalonyl-CoA carboxyltransferase small subunit
LKLKITVDGKVYEVDVDVDEPAQPHVGYVPPSSATRVSADAPAAKPGGGSSREPAAGPSVDENKVCRSPISGLVARVSAQAGQSIQSNDVLMVLEAMKMETMITSPIAGKVAKVNVAVGDPVQGGQVLVEFE